MKLLDVNFISGDGGFGADPLTYKQLVRNDKFAVYERSRDGVVKDYETIKIKVLKAGTRIFKQVLDADEERYPGTSEFGKTAWSYGGVPSAALSAAMDKFEKLSKAKDEVEEPETFEAIVASELNVEPKQRGRKRMERPPLVYPATEQFGMKDLVTVNDKWNQPMIYVQLQKDIEGGMVVEVGRVKNDSGRGKPSVVYKTVGV